MPDVRKWKGIEYESLVARMKVVRSREMEVDITIHGGNTFTIGINHLRPLADALKRVADEIATE